MLLGERWIWHNVPWRQLPEELANQTLLLATLTMGYNRTQDQISYLFIVNSSLTFSPTADNITNKRIQGSCGYGSFAGKLV